MFVLVVFPGEVSKLLADMETDMSLKERKALSFSGKCLDQNIPRWFTQGKLMQTVNNNQLLHVYRSKLALYLLPLQVLIVPNLRKFWNHKYIWCMLGSNNLARKHYRPSIGLINWKKNNIFEINPGMLCEKVVSWDNYFCDSQFGNKKMHFI